MAVLKTEAIAKRKGNPTEGGKEPGNQKNRNNGRRRGNGKVREEKNKWKNR